MHRKPTHHGGTVSRTTKADIVKYKVNMAEGKADRAKYKTNMAKGKANRAKYKANMAEGKADRVKYKANMAKCVARAWHTRSFYDKTLPESLDTAIKQCYNKERPLGRSFVATRP